MGHRVLGFRDATSLWQVSKHGAKKGSKITCCWTEKCTFPHVKSYSKPTRKCGPKSVWSKNWSKKYSKKELFESVHLSWQLDLFHHPMGRRVVDFRGRGNPTPDDPSGVESGHFRISYKCQPWQGSSSYKLSCATAFVCWAPCSFAKLTRGAGWIPEAHEARSLLSKLGWIG
jgi:hypothetical protein